MADHDSLSDEDKALFREHMRTVKPLGKSTKKAPDTAKKAPTPRPPKRPMPEVAQEAVFLSDFIQETVYPDTILSYKTQNIPNKRFKELKHGAIRWQAKIDLHGLTIEAARSALITFMQNAIQQSKQCVLIIHGKGGHLGAPPVIKNHVYRWLPQFLEVLAFHSAQPKDGGHGAVYVLLKKTLT